MPSSITAKGEAIGESCAANLWRVTIVFAEEIDVTILIVGLVGSTETITECISENITVGVEDTRVAPNSEPKHLIRLTWIGKARL